MVKKVIYPIEVKEKVIQIKIDKIPATIIIQELEVKHK